jgi:hypothetical protein
MVKNLLMNWRDIIRVLASARDSRPGFRTVLNLIYGIQASAGGQKTPDANKGLACNHQGWAGGPPVAEHWTAARAWPYGHANRR